MKKFIVWLIRFIINIIARVKASGYENLPEKGGFVIAVNHLGFLDAPMAYYALNNWNLFIPVAEKWEESVILRWLGKHLNAIFIDRFNPDLQSDARNDQAHGRRTDSRDLLPEGTRARDEKMAQGKPGVAYLASKMGWTIVPVAIIGTEDRIVIQQPQTVQTYSHSTRLQGKSFTLPPFPKENRDEKLQEYTDEIMCRIAVMLPEKNRGYYAEHSRLKQLLTEKQ